MDDLIKKRSEYKMIKKEMNVLDEIKKLNEILENIKELTEDKKIIDMSISELNTIIEDNKDEKDFKNIGIKVNKFNIDKYLKAKECMDNVVSLFPKIKINENEKGVNIIKFNSIKSVRVDEEIQENIKRRINSYNNSATPKIKK